MASEVGGVREGLKKKHKKVMERGEKFFFTVLQIKLVPFSVHSY